MSILVTGGAGFIGANLLKELGKSEEQIYLIDNFNDYYDPSLKNARVESLVPKHTEVLNMDLCERDELEKLLKKIKPTTVYHLAAQAGVRLSLEENYKYVDSNLRGFSNIIELSLRADVRNFLYASSSSVYGNSPKIPYSEEDSGLAPISFYGASKLSNEILAGALVRGSSMKTRGLRFFTVYGPWGRPDMAYFRIAESLFNNRKFNLFGTGEVLRDFTYVDDVVTSIIGLSRELQTNNLPIMADIVNVGGGKPSSMKELIAAFEKVSGLRLMINHEAQISTDVNQTIADSSKLRKLTNSIPEIDLFAGVANFLEWARKPEIAPNLKSWVDSVG